MKMLLITLLPFFCSLSDAQTKQNDLKEMNVIGNVKSIIEKWYSPTRQANKITTYRFNADGYKEEELDDVIVDKTKRRTTYKYDPNGLKVEMNTFENDELTSRFTFIYDLNGNMTEERLLNLDGSLENKTIYKYDNNGNNIEEIQYASGGRMLLSKYTYSYDDKGNKIEWNSYNQDGTLFQKTYFRYDGKRNMIENESYMNGKISSKYTVKYDSNNNIIEQVNYDDNGKAYIKRVNKYELDKNLNWIKRIESLNGKVTDIIERELNEKETTLKGSDPLKASSSKLNIELLTTKPKGYETPDCSYSKKKGEPPIFLTDFMGNGVMKINREIVTLKLSNTDMDKSGKLIYTYSNGKFIAILKTGSDFKAGYMTIKFGQNTSQINVIGNCSTEGGD